ncbi:FecR domain-containing protein, partial [Candidatus Dependentiae bacterium]|nr:FecR domain-containing protein [Candidatus Dependentiae bacterium]
MKQQLLFLIIIIFGISVCSEAVEISKIIEISGNAVIADTENNETTPKPGMILLPGYILKTSENSKIIFNLYNVYILELAENSELKILGLKITSTKQKQKNADMMFKLIKGEVSGTVNKRKSKSLKSNFIIETDYSKNFVNNAVFSVISKDYSIVSVDTGTVIIEKNIKNDDNKNIKAVSNTKVIIKSEKTEIDSENKFDSAVTEFLPEYFDKPIIIDQGYNKIGNQDEYEYYIK